MDVGEGVVRRGKEVQEDGDSAVNLLDMLALAETLSKGGARARSHSGRGHGMPERRSPRALVHTVP